VMSCAKVGRGGINLHKNCFIPVFMIFNFRFDKGKMALTNPSYLHILKTHISLRIIDDTCTLFQYS